MLTAPQLASMRATLNTTLVDSAAIYRKTTQNIGGEEVATWSLLTTTPCRIAPVGGGESGEAGGRIAEESTHVITVAAETDVEEADVVAVSGTAYEPTLIRKRGSWELSRRIEAKESVDGIPEVDDGS